MTSAILNCHRAPCCAQSTITCGPTQANPSLLFVLEKVSLVALTVLSAISHLPFFLSFGALGAALGAHQYIQQKNSGQFAKLAPSCTQGVLEQITGIRLPAPVTLLANVAITASHVFHHSPIFVPVVALSVGAYIGKTIAMATQTT